ncbi:MAG: phosphoadenosine phosphosulfate reductase family protein [Pseudomonadota bacterium]
MSERHVLGLSGGRDSAALAVYLSQQRPDTAFDYYFADTGKELPETYEYLGRLEGFLGRPIIRINARHDFDFWLREYNYFLPSPQTRWCTRQLKLAPFEEYIRPMLAAGDSVVSYVALRADENDRQGYTPRRSRVTIRYPLREGDIDAAGVTAILQGAGLGLPAFYDWRSRSGCTFCFYQQKIEWVRLKERHPRAFKEAKAYEKIASEHSSPFTWSQGESLSDLEQPERTAEIIADFEKRVQRIGPPPNPLTPAPAAPMLNIDELYGDDEGGGACAACRS